MNREKLAENIKLLFYSKLTSPRQLYCTSILIWCLKTTRKIFVFTIFIGLYTMRVSGYKTVSLIITYWLLLDWKVDFLLRQRVISTNYSPPENLHRQLNHLLKGDSVNHHHLAANFHHLY